LDLNGSSIGIVGHGSLGKRIAEIGSAFGMRPLVAERKGSASRKGRYSFDEVLRESDVLCITCPLTAETQGLVGPQELKLMKPTALLINCSRGRIVDDGALANALRQNLLGGAGLDVIEEEPPRKGNPLLELDIPNLIVTPHMAFASQQSLQALAEQLMSNIEAFVAGQPRNLVT
jgi:glycerate dehydrogenase